MMMSYDDAGTEPIRRFEVFTGAGRRRSWTDEGKAEILAESYSGSESISAVARRHGLSPSQLFTWRRELRKASAAAASPSFVPAIVDAAPPPSRDKPPAPKRRRTRRTQTTGTVVELEIDGVGVKISQGADPTVIAAVIDALKMAR
jgi:transposase